jgi:hypothetical protein
MQTSEADPGFWSAHEQDKRRCPKCDAASDELPIEFQVYQFAVPAGFRTSLRYNGDDAAEDAVFAQSGAASVAQRDPVGAVDIPGTNTELEFASGGRVFRVNDARGQLYSGSLGMTTQNGAGGTVLENQWIEQSYQTGNGFSFVPTGLEEQIALAAPKTTDVLRVRTARVPIGLRLDPVASDTCARAALYSAAFLLRSCVAVRLDIEAEEIDVSYVSQYSPSGGDNTGEIVLSDHLANGAGFVNWIAQNWSEALDLALNPPPSSFAEDLMTESHRKACSTASYDCLFSFRNMPYHGLLDWRLAVSALRCHQDAEYRCGLDGDFSHPELEDWISQAQELRDLFCAHFSLDAEDFGQLPGLRIAGRNLLVVHPLWSTFGNSGAEGILGDAVGAAADREVRFVDTFNLARRETWCYQRATLPSP